MIYLIYTNKFFQNYKVFESKLTYSNNLCNSFHPSEYKNFKELLKMKTLILQYEDKND